MRILNRRGLIGRNLVQSVAAVGVAAAAAGVLAACGGSTAPSAPAAAASTQSGAGGNSANSAYLDCLRQNGVAVPTAFPSRGQFTARPTDRPTDRPSGFRGGGGGFFGGQSQSPQMQAAVQACASVRPTSGFGGGGFGFGGGRGGTQLTAFRNCMTQQGVTIPTTRPTSFPTARPTAFPTGSARYLDGLNPSDPKVAAALKVCSPLLPSPGARPSSQPTG